jgi:branched-chain amino acid transport system ATP-binding protein
MLTLKNLDVYYDKTEAVKNVSMQVETNRVVALLGSNGAGKTTILNTISGFVAPKSGQIEYNNRSILGKKPQGIVREGIIQVSQGRDLFPELSVMENLRLGAVLERDRQKVAKAFDEVFEIFPILKERKSQKAGTLSGGEQQMLATGRALMSGPHLLLLDEPTTGLAPIYVKRIEQVLRDCKKKGITMLLVEQNTPVAVSLAEYYYVLRNGKIVAEGETHSLPEDASEFFAKYYIE